MKIVRPKRPLKMFTPSEQIKRLSQLVKIRDEAHMDDRVTIQGKEVLEPRVLYPRSMGKNFQWLKPQEEFPNAPKQSKTLKLLMNKLHRNT